MLFLLIIYCRMYSNNLWINSNATANFYITCIITISSWIL